MNKYTRLYLNYTKCGPFFNDYMGEFLVSIYNCRGMCYLGCMVVGIFWK